MFGASDGRRIGEIWFEQPDGSELPLLPKYLLAAERLSVQVHPSGEGPGEPRVSSEGAECWYVVDAQEGATVGFGLKQEMSPDDVRSAALDGSLPELLVWHPVKKDDFIFVPSGVVHAIGAGLTIVEFQQSADVTYRLFDYERGRPVQIEDALAVAELGPPDPANFVRADGPDDRILVSVPQFTVARISTAEGAKWMAERRRWVVPVSGSVTGGAITAEPGDCLLVAPGDEVSLQRSSIALVAIDAAAHNRLSRR